MTLFMLVRNAATSLLLLEHEVYLDKGFREGLMDAVQSLTVGSA